MRSRQISCCFTGHRPGKLPWRYHEAAPACLSLKRRIANAAEAAYEEGYRHFLCGMALGCDLYFCEAALALRERFPERCVRLPMVDGARSLNLGNSAAVLVYEALRQNGFPGLLDTGEMARLHTEGNDYHTNQTSVTSV